MGVGLVVVLVVTGLLVLLPLWFAWLSMDSRRWQRVERILGREPSGKEPPRWLWWVWIGLSGHCCVEPECARKPSKVEALLHRRPPRRARTTRPCL
jgi:hypothetical protein